MLEITLEQFEKAKQIIRHSVLYSPLIPYPFQSNILLKADCLQPTGSFKIRGATYAISQLSPEQRKRGVIAYSTGNHAQAVALAAREQGIKATIVMSPEALDFKVAATRQYGAEVIIVPASERKKFTEELAKKTGATFFSPFDHPDIITGDGTIGIEILECVQPAAVFVPIGGGGLIAGIAAAIKQKKPEIKMIGVEPELENDAWRTFHTGKLTKMEAPSASVADAIKIPMLGELTYPLIKKYVDDIITVTEQQIIEATRQSLENCHLLTEPSGAIALAGALIYPQKFSNKPIVCINSGGNITLKQLYTIL